MWEIVNRGRRVNENIEEKEWRGYFMNLLGGIEHRVMRGSRDRRNEDGEGETRRK